MSNIHRVMIEYSMIGTIGISYKNDQQINVASSSEYAIGLRITLLNTLKITQNVRNFLSEIRQETVHC